MKEAAVLGVALLVFSLATILPAAASAMDGDVPPVYVVVFTHVEDNTPGGLLGTPQSRQNYRTQRDNLIAMATLAENAGVQWTLQPDWKILEAALLYEDSTLQATTNDKNFLRYLKEDRVAVIDPHSHENDGHNYTDVAHLLDSLGVGATSVIGGHIWDPASPFFQEWDRFRVPVSGERYPGATWRGDILIGSGTPNHANDPQVSGVWRPRDRDHYFEHDATANIVCVGGWKKSIESIAELISLRRSGAIPPEVMLTFSCNINPTTLGAPGGLAAVADTVFAPLVAWRDSGLVVPTDFTTLVATWATIYGGLGYFYDAQAPVVDVEAIPAAPASLHLAEASPNPVVSTTLLRYSLAREAHVRVSIHDVRGREVSVPVDGLRPVGDHAVAWDARAHSSGVYLIRLVEKAASGIVAESSRKVVVAR